MYLGGNGLNCEVTWADEQPSVNGGTVAHAVVYHNGTADELVRLWTAVYTFY